MEIFLVRRSSAISVNLDRKIHKEHAREYEPLVHSIQFRTLAHRFLLDQWIFVSIPDCTKVSNIWLNDSKKRSIERTCKMGGGPTEPRLGISGNELMVDSARSGV